MSALNRTSQVIVQSSVKCGDCGRLFSVTAKPGRSIREAAKSVRYNLRMHKRSKHGSTK